MCAPLKPSGSCSSLASSYMDMKCKRYETLMTNENHSLHRTPHRTQIRRSVGGTLAVPDRGCCRFRAERSAKKSR